MARRSGRTRAIEPTRETRVKTRRGSFFVPRPIVDGDVPAELRADAPAAVEAPQLTLEQGQAALREVDGQPVEKERSPDGHGPAGGYPPDVGHELRGHGPPDLEDDAVTDIAGSPVPMETVGHLPAL